MIDFWVNYVCILSLKYLYQLIFNDKIIKFKYDKSEILTMNCYLVYLYHLT